MAISTRGDGSQGSLVFGRAGLLYVLTLAIVLLPIRFHFFKYVVLATFVMICVDVGTSVIRNPRVPYTPIYVAILALTLVYLVWLPYSVLLGNDLTYVFKDSAGFLVYLVFPFLFVFVSRNRLQKELHHALLIAACTVAAINVCVFVGFYATFGRLDLETISVVNQGLSGLGFTWELGASSGLLRANTKAGHYLLVGIALLFLRFLHNRRRRELLLIGILLASVVLDGHKALVVAAAIFGILMLPLFVAVMERFPIKIVTPIAAVLPIMIIIFTVYIDVNALLQRFISLDSPSFSVRGQQIEPLLHEISNRPIFGNGFGSSADIIRSIERPFMYELDFLAVTMKVGFIGAVVYFGTYLLTIGYQMAAGNRSPFSWIMLSLGLAYFFYMGTNGGFAMSPISAFFHVLVFTSIATGCSTPGYGTADHAIKTVRRYQLSSSSIGN